MYIIYFICHYVTLFFQRFCFCFVCSLLCFWVVCLKCVRVFMLALLEISVGDSNPATSPFSLLPFPTIGPILYLLVWNVCVVVDVGGSNSEGKRRRPWCHRHLCLLECSWTISWQCTNHSGIWILISLNSVSKFSSTISHCFFLVCVLFLWCWVAVQFWREVRSGTVHQDSAKGGALCPSSHWTLCVCWVELWVHALSTFPSGFLWFLSINA